MKVYTIAKKISKVYGHGDSGNEYHICPIDGYHTNSIEFHPLFREREEAERYLLELDMVSVWIIVELEIQTYIK